MTLEEALCEKLAGKRARWCKGCEEYHIGLTACKRCACGSRNLGFNPNRPTPPWQRCWTCGALWDGEGDDLIAELPVLALTRKARVDYWRGKTGRWNDDPTDEEIARACSPDRS